MIEWSLVKKRISDLKDYDKNPRSMKKKAFDHLVRSIQEDGYHHRILADTDGTIIGGHSRKKALKKAGYSDSDEIEVLVPNRKLTAEEFDRINIRDNLGYGDFDFDILSQNFEASTLIDWGFPEDLLDFKVDIDISEEDEKEGSANEDKVITKRGDIWILGNHTLMCGDSTSIDDVEKLMNDQVMDCVYTDPPYGINLLTNNKRSVGSGSQEYSPIIGDDSIDAARDSYNLCKALKIDKMLFWGGNHYSECLPSSKCWIVWYKMTEGMHIDFADCELAWTNLDDQARVFHHMWTGFCKDSEREEKRIHPTQKPIKLATEIFEFFDFGKNVLDLFGGSGSTLIACEKSNRTCFMMEMSEFYCDAIINRFEKATGIKAELKHGI